MSVVSEFLECGVIALKTCHGKYLSAKSKGGLNADREEALSWETFEVAKKEGNKIALKTYHGTYVRVNTDGTVSTTNGNEIFEVKEIGENKIALIASNGKYLSVQKNGTFTTKTVKEGQGIPEDGVFTFFNPISDRFVLKTCYGKYLSSWKNRSYIIDANCDVPSIRATFGFIKKEDKKIALRTFHGKYVCVESNGSVTANKDKDLKGIEIFVVEKIGENKIALIASNGKYLSAGEGGTLTTKIVEKGQDIPEDAVFTFASTSFMAKKANFQSAYGKYLSVQENCTIKAASDVASAYETFDVIEKGEEKIALRAFHGKFVCAESNGNIIANRNIASTWETFDVIKIAEGMVALRTYHGKYLSAQPDGTLKASSDEINVQETFSITVFERCLCETMKLK